MASNRAKYRRARIRNFLFTIGPNRLSRGRLAARHLGQATELREIELASPLWPGAFDGLRIAHVSDFHVGELMTVDSAIDAVGLVAEAGCDLLACTGDLVDLHHHDAPPVLDALAAVDAACGTFIVLGNHDELHCADTFRGQARDAGLTVLDDDAVLVKRGDDELVVAGLHWAKTPAACAKRLDRACPDGCDLLLAHNPKAFPAAAGLGIPLVLSGHTHGGQVALPGRPGANLAISHRRSAGVYEIDDSRLHVTTGVGAWFPLRVNCPPEVVIVTMRHA